MPREKSVVYVKHDPFARGAYRRECLGGGVCNWCGQERRRTYTYMWEPDGSSMTVQQLGARGFCNFSCFKAFYGD